MTHNIDSIKPEYKTIIMEIIEKHIPNSRVFLFGSRARGTNAPESDIDIALESKTIISSYTISLIKEELEESRIPFCVDIVDLKAISVDMKSVILKEKIEWEH